MKLDGLTIIIQIPEDYVIKFVLFHHLFHITKMAQKTLSFTERLYPGHIDLRYSDIVTVYNYSVCK